MLEPIPSVIDDQDLTEQQRTLLMAGQLLVELSDHLFWIARLQTFSGASNPAMDINLECQPRIGAMVKRILSHIPDNNIEPSPAIVVDIPKGGGA